MLSAHSKILKGAAGACVGAGAFVGASDESEQLMEPRQQKTVASLHSKEAKININLNDN